jgi:hypothetical protein
LVHRNRKNTGILINIVKSKVKPNEKVKLGCYYATKTSVLFFMCRNLKRSERGREVRDEGEVEGERERHATCLNQLMWKQHCQNRPLGLK